MNKQEYIARYGIEHFEEMRQRHYEQKRRKKEGLPPLERQKNQRWVKDNIVVKIACPLPDIEDVMERVDAEEEIAYRVQKAMVRGWMEITDQQFILIVSAGNKVKGKDMFYLKCDLYQLRMDGNTQKKFKEFCNSREWVS